MITPMPMTRGRWLALAFGAPPALALIGWIGLSEVAYAGQGSYHVRFDMPVNSRTVSVSSDQADLTVSRAAGDLRLTGTAHYSLVRSQVTFERRANGVIVHSRCRFAATGVCSFDYQVSLPARLPAFISDGSGDVTLRGTTGRVTASTGSGNIDASNTSGVLDLEAGSGDVSGTGLAGPRAKLVDHAGDITFLGVTSADVTASNDSGDVTIVFATVPDQVSITNESGNVTLVLPSSPARYQLNANTSSGNRTVTLPTSVRSTHAISVSVQSGDISITN